MLCIQSFAQKNNTSINSKIEKVTIFLQGAQVERTARQYLPVGKHQIVFAEISPRIDKQSIQLKADGKLTVLSVTHQINYLKEQQIQEEVKQLVTQKELLQDKINLEISTRNVYVQEEQMILKNQSIKGDNATLKAAELKEAADFQRQRLLEIYQKLQELDRAVKKMNAEMDKLNKQLIELNQKKEVATSEVLVSIDVKEAATIPFRLSYLVKQSSWYPTYDIRVQDISKPISLQMKANVTQQSGEDWKDVKMFLSTANPNENGVKPTLLPWYLRYYIPTPTSNIRIRGNTSIELSGAVSGVNVAGTVSGMVRDERGIPVPGAAIQVKGTQIGSIADNSGNFRIQVPANASTLVASSVGFDSKEIPVTPGYLNVVLNANSQALSEVVVVGYGSSSDYSYSEEDRNYKKRKQENSIQTTTIYQPTNTLFEIEEPYSVPNDGKLYTVDISTYDVNALYEYYAAPKLDQSAYLTARIIDWQELNLLPGEANLFFEGTFLGNSFLDVLNAGDTLNLSLGKDKGVVVKRTLMKEYSSKKMLGSNKTDKRQYEIVVRNNKQQPIQIMIEDQFPVSTNKDIEVDKLAYDNGKLDDDTKKVVWNFALEPKKENKIQLGYAVKCPKDKLLQLE